MFVLTVVLTAVLALAYTGAGGSKLAGIKPMRDAADHFGLPWNRYRSIGILEIAAVVGLLIGLVVPALGVAAAVGLVALMIGALTFHLRAGDPPKVFAPVPVLALLAVGYIIARLASA